MQTVGVNRKFTLHFHSIQFFYGVSVVEKTVSNHCHISVYSKGQKKFPFRLRATIVLQCECLRSVLRNHSALRLLIQQLLPPGVSG